MTPAQARAELARRQKRASFTAENVLHEAQQRIRNEIRGRGTVTISAGRRFGKSEFAIFLALETALATPGVSVLLVAATQASIEGIFWQRLKKFVREYKLGDPPRKGTKWSWTAPNGSEVILLPVDTVEAGDKLLGRGRVALTIVDETQRYKAEVLSHLLLSVLAAMRLDLEAAGYETQQILMGTPNRAGKVGTFWDYISREGTAHFTGTIYDNSKLGTREQIEKAVDKLLKEEKQSRDGAWFQREIMAVWGAIDVADRAYKFTEAKNIYADAPPDLCNYLVCGDTGVKDEDALGLLAWSDTDPTVYLLREHIRRGQDDDDLGAVLQSWYEEFRPFLVVLDAGAAAKSVLTLQNRYRHIPIVAATKPAINQQVAELNDFLTNGLFKCRADSRFRKEIVLATWKNQIVNGKLEEDGAKKSNIVPSIRYGLLAAREYLPDAIVAVAPEEPDDPILAQLLAKMNPRDNDDSFTGLFGD